MRNSQSEYKRKRNERLEIISSLYKRGYTYRQIRTEVMARLNLSSYSMQTVHKDINILLEEWRSMRIDNLDHAVQLELERLNMMRKEAWDAWDKSKQDYSKQRSWMHGVPKGGDGKENDEKKMQTTHISQQKENMVNCGDPRYLDIIQKCNAEECKLLGLYAPEKREVTGKDGKDLNPNIQVEIIDRREQIDEATDD